MIICALHVSKIFPLFCAKNSLRILPHQKKEKEMQCINYVKNTFLNGSLVGLNQAMSAWLF